jgi:selenocysteine lyase/cysteine desulfurase
VIDLAGLRSEFPVLERLSYLNAGTNGPVPRRATDAARDSLVRQANEGRSGRPFFDAVVEAAELVRIRVAAVIGCEPGELALTGSTTDGVNTVVSGLELGPGDEVLTSDEEHPGVLAPLAGQRARRGVGVRVVPFDSIASEVRPETRLVAVSHVSWITGRVVDCRALARAGAPVLLDGAQSLGAIPVDVRELGCDFYAAAGQKWLCGPNGLGYLYVRGERIPELAPAWPWYSTVADAHHALDSPLRENAARFDLELMPPHHSAWALAALDALEEPGLEDGQHRAVSLAARLVELLSVRGARVAPRGESTLVSWESSDPEAEAERLLAENIVVRSLPETPWVRASVGAWTTEQELERLVGLVG